MLLPKRLPTCEQRYRDQLFHFLGAGSVSLLEAFRVHTRDFRYISLVDAQRPERRQAGAAKYMQAREAETLTPSVL